MNNEEMVKKAASILTCSFDRIEEKEVAGSDARYYRNIDRGGAAVIVSSDGEFLFADPFFVSYDEHVKRFFKGERTEFDVAND